MSTQFLKIFSISRYCLIWPNGYFLYANLWKSISVENNIPLNSIVKTVTHVNIHGVNELLTHLGERSL